ncbi:MAG TPA: PspC domain-containing protein [Candidatus Woesebacteria bacterium]|nr:PspC domain-containing protein [Candidatus Woesebacteria bacterium]HPJ17364.1 PspC domain-containing protein [Candidatus Woesebacteria bacterium]
MENIKKLFLSDKEKMIAGVCGGIAEYFDLDPTIVRVLFVILGLWGGIGLILYIAMMIIVPKREIKAIK